jgi:hypothetical protein
MLIAEVCIPDGIALFGGIFIWYAFLAVANR